MANDTTHHDIAIIGMSCRVAGASSPSELWENLVNSKDVRSQIDRFTGFYHPDGGRRKGLTNVRHAYTIENGVEAFDNGFFSIAPPEAVAMDIQQRLLLELTYEAFENAGISLDRVRKTDTGVYIGVHGTSDYASSLLRDLDATAKYTATGTSSAIQANRISYAFDLHGASMILDTACSSTIVALHQAIAAIRSNESKMAIVAGANVILDSAMFVHMSELGFLSPRGRCRSFDANGDGYARGEGVLAMILKPLPDAIRDGDHIRAVVKATRINQDGRTQGLTLPSAEAQQQNLEGIYKRSGVNPLDVQYVEAHGTGTAVGDPLELSAINAVFTKDRTGDPLVVGSIKSNIGHLEAGAALAGIVKTVLALEHAQIPPQMNLERLNPKIDWSRTRVPTAMEDWPSSRSGKRVAGINSFGFGGTNGHAILEAYENASPTSVDYERPYLFMVSAASTSSLAEVQSQLAQYLETHHPELRSLAHTLLARRSLLKYSRFVSAATHEELAEKLRDKEMPVQTRSEEKADSLTFVFTGQGAQWPEMGAKMIAQSPLFRSTMRELDDHLAKLPDRPDWSISEELSKSKQISRVYLSSFSQPLCSAIQIGLVDVLRSWGIRPQAVLGHSSGEVAAAYTAGILSRRDAIVVAYYRGLFLGSDKAVDSSVQPAGGMCAVGLSEFDTRKLISTYPGRISLAAVNSPSSCTLSGDYGAIQEITQQCSSDGTFCRTLRVDMAYHSHHMLPKSGIYQDAMEKAGVSPISQNAGVKQPKMFSSVFGRSIQAKECTPEYWKENMISTVKFLHALTAAATEVTPKAMLEIGPHPALKGPAGDSLAAMDFADVPYLGTLSRGKPDFESLLATVGFLVSDRCSLNLQAVNAIDTIAEDGEVWQERGTVLVDLPRYSWDHSQAFNAESRLSRNTRRREFARHELLGARLANDNELRTMWRNLLMTEEITWLKDLIDRGHTYMPEIIYILMINEAARQVYTSRKLEVRLVRIHDVAFGDPLDLSLFATGTTTVETLFTLSRRSERMFTFSIVFCVDSEKDLWCDGCSGRLELLVGSDQLPQRVEPVVHDQETLQYYESFGDALWERVSSHSVSSSAISGDIVDAGENHEGYCVDPVQLADISRLPQYLLMAQRSNASNKFRLASVSCIEIPAGNWRVSNGIFRVDAIKCDAAAGWTSVSLSDNDKESFSIQLNEMCWTRLGETAYKPPLRSLFYTHTLALDISVAEVLVDPSLQRVIELATHKWPMADIVISNLETAVHDQVLSMLKGIKDHERPRFRSVTEVGDGVYTPVSDRVSNKVSLKELVLDNAHLVLGSASEISTLIHVVRDTGIICALIDEGSEKVKHEQLHLLGNFEDTESRHWLVARKHVPKEGIQSRPKTFVFATEDIPTSWFKENSGFEVVRFDRSTTWSSPLESFGIIVLDFGQQSLLVDWDGKAILSWIPSLLEEATHILWIGRDNEQYVAPPFIKTVHAEHPEIQVSTLLLRDTPDSRCEELILQRYDALISSRAEMEEYCIGGILNTKRYQPDDTLSASVGKLPPIKSQGPVGDQDYGLSLLGRGQVGISVRRSPTDVYGDTVELQVMHSILDLNDMSAFQTGHAKVKGSSLLGHLCVGIVTKSISDKFIVGTHVVAWTSGAHGKLVRADEDQLLEVDPEHDLVNSLVVCYFGAMAMSIILTVRAGPEDEFKVDSSPTLGAFISAAKSHLGHTSSPAFYHKQTFEIDLCHQRGVYIDGDPVTVLPLLHSHTKEMLKKLIQERANKTLDVERFGISDAQLAFQRADRGHKAAIVLDHTRVSSLQSHHVTYIPPVRLFRPDRAYIIVGFGGLARHVAAWMAYRGAKHLYALSRRGLQSNGALEAVEELRSAGCELKLLAADASNSVALSKTLEMIRGHQQIGGILNMVMVLGDAPFLTMSPEQWDQCVDAKVKSTKNTHAASLHDNLEFFIMFSSIASISGNRMQANYATANAFQNAFAQYRQSLGLTAIAVALGAITGIGVLANDQALLRTLSQTGFYQLNARDLEKILEACVNESRFGDRALLATGFNMYRTFDGHVQSKPEENQLYWTESAEFGFMLEHNLSGSQDAKEISLGEKLSQATGAEAHELLLDGMISCLSNVLGYDSSAFDPKSPVSAYGLDSLHAVSVRYWFFNTFGISVPVFDVLGCKSINELVSRSLSKFQSSLEENKTTIIPDPKRSKDLTIRPLSHSQQRLFFLQRFIPDKTVYNLLLICEATGRIDVKRFKVAWTMFLQRHEVLYSKIISTEDGFQQLPRRDAFFPIEHFEVSDAEYATAAEDIKRTARSLHFRPELGELVRGYVLECPSRMKFFIASHHLAWDRASTSVVFEETSAIYQALVAGQNPEEILRPDPIQFIEYTMWQNECISKPEIVDPQVDYWKKKLDGAPESVSLLPTAITSMRPSVKEYRGESISFQFEASLTSRLRDFCKANAATPFMLLTAALSALVHRLTGDEDIVVGIFDGDRGHSAFDKMIGFTINMLPIRTKPSSDITFSALLEECRTACLEAYEHRFLPFDYLLQILKVPRRTAHSAVTQITVNYQMQGAFSEVDYGDFRFTEFDHYNARLQTDFGFDIEESLDGNLHFNLEYDPQLYSHVGMQKFGRQYRAAVESILNSSGSLNLGALSVDSDEDREIMQRSLQPETGPTKPLQDLDEELFPWLFQQATNSFPTKTALADNLRSVTYAELDLMTNAIAKALIESGVKVGDAVGVYCEQSVSLLIAIYGVIRAGCAYVPIDPDYPEARIESMIEDADIAIVLVDTIDKRAVPLLACGIEGEHIFEVDKTATIVSGSHSPVSLSRAILAKDPLCYIFTSGSTGKPKCIGLTHGMLRYQQEEYNKILENSAEERIALGVAMVFDLSLCSIFGSILLGATTIVATREQRLNAARMVDLLVDEKVTSVIFSPTQLKALFTAPNRYKLRDWKSLRNLTGCGEALPPWIVREFHSLSLADAKFYNAYAPAETTVVNSIALMRPEDGETSDCYIAGPMPTNRFYILDKHMYPVPLGSSGELYIGGVTVADGYMKRPELSAKVFHDSPERSGQQWSAFTRMYQTGDSFNLTEDGRLHCIGRIGGDRQVKIRGMRTELGEIEAAIFDANQQLGSSPGPRLSLTAVVYTKDGAGEGTLVAYLCLNQGAKTTSADEHSLEHYLRTTLKETLPFHMIPSIFVFVPDIPKTGSNKTDYKALLALPLPEKKQQRIGKTGAALPLTPTQKKIAETWKETLNIEGELSSSDNFFALSGHSMLLINVWSGIKKQIGVELQLADMFARPTVAGMESLCLEALVGTMNGTSGVNGTNSTNSTHMNGHSNGNGRHTPSGSYANGHSAKTDIDWVKEASLAETADWLIDQPIFNQPEAIAMTGACSMIGAQLLQHVLTNTAVNVHCIAVNTSPSTDALTAVISSLRQWKLDSRIPSSAFDRVRAYSGKLSAANLGLDTSQARLIESSVQAIYHLDSEVSLLKDYSSIRAGNLGAIHALLNLAASSTNPKPIHYLSTWGVPHLQAWRGTSLSSAEWITSETEMTNMVPAPSSELGYLKCRWACEALLGAAARRGVLVTIIRTTMCAPAPDTGTCVTPSDINRRIIAASLAVGGVPDFQSAQGGGMSWITADVLVKGMWCLTHKKLANTGVAKVRHVISEQHVSYEELAAMLSTEETPMESVPPQEWFRRLRAKPDPEMHMHAAVLEKWCAAGWVPFRVESKETMQLLKEAGIQAHTLDRKMLLDLVVGDEIF